MGRRGHSLNFRNSTGVWDSNNPLVQNYVFLGGCLVCVHQQKCVCFGVSSVYQYMYTEE